MPATFLLLGEPDWVGLLFYLLILLASVGGFALVVFFIYVKVFRGGWRGITTIGPGAAGGRNDEQR